MERLRRRLDALEAEMEPIRRRMELLRAEAERWRTRRDEVRGEIGWRLNAGGFHRGGR